VEDFFSLKFPFHRIKIFFFFILSPHQGKVKESKVLSGSKICNNCTNPGQSSISRYFNTLDKPRNIISADFVQKNGRRSLRTAFPAFFQISEQLSGRGGILTPGSQLEEFF
jgi:hypothetical protein